MISHHLIKHEPTIHLILKVNIIDTRDHKQKNQRRVRSLAFGLRTLRGTLKRVLETVV